VIWFVKRDQDGNLTCSGSDGSCFNVVTGSTVYICFGIPNETDLAKQPAIEISYFYDADLAHKAVMWSDYSSVSVVRSVYDPKYDRGQPLGISQPLPGCPNGSWSTLPYNTPAFNISNLGCMGQGCLLFMTIKSLYNTTSSQFGVVASGSLAPQGIQIESSGSSGNAVRKLQAQMTYPANPPIFDSGLFSGSNMQQ
jgi:hypothetical protein